MTIYWKWFNCIHYNCYLKVWFLISIHLGIDQDPSQSLKIVTRNFTHFLPLVHSSKRHKVMRFFLEEACPQISSSNFYHSSLNDSLHLLCKLQMALMAIGACIHEPHRTIATKKKKPALNQESRIPCSYTKD